MSDKELEDIIQRRFGIGATMPTEWDSRNSYIKETAVEIKKLIQEAVDKAVVAELTKLADTHDQTCTAKGYGGWCCEFLGEVRDRISTLRGQDATEE